MPNLLLARHAESVYNAQGRISCDPADTQCVLSESGKTQAETLGRELQGRHLDLCITSELLRTRQTADIALATRDVRRTVLPDFNDPLAGDFEGRALSDYRVWVDANGGVNAVPPGGGESLETALRRFARGYRWLANRNEAEILVIAHASPISALLSALDGGPIEGRTVEYATIHRVHGRTASRGDPAPNCARGTVRVGAGRRYGPATYLTKRTFSTVRVTKTMRALSLVG